jgi:hypothetical protein
MFSSEYITLSKVKVKMYLAIPLRPGQALRVPGG